MYFTKCTKWAVCKALNSVQFSLGPMTCINMTRRVGITPRPINSQMSPKPTRVINLTKLGPSRHLFLYFRLFNR